MVLSSQVWTVVCLMSWIAQMVLPCIILAPICINCSFFCLFILTSLQIIVYEFILVPWWSFHLHICFMSSGMHPWFLFCNKNKELTQIFIFDTNWQTRGVSCQIFLHLFSSISLFVHVISNWVGVKCLVFCKLLLWG